MESTICPKCNMEITFGSWPWCPHFYVGSPAIHGDECDIVIKNGACWPNGEPRRFRSKAEIKRVAFEQGWTQHGDTPKVNQRLEEKKAKEREERNKR